VQPRLDARLRARGHRSASDGGGPLQVSIERFAFQKSCGAYIFGTTDTHYCNCYHAEHGYMEIDRGPGVEPAPGKMSVFFALNDKDTTSPEDWQVVVDAPTG